MPTFLPCCSSYFWKVVVSGNFSWIFTQLRHSTYYNRQEDSPYARSVQWSMLAESGFETTIAAIAVLYYSKCWMYILSFLNCKVMECPIIMVLLSPDYRQSCLSISEKISSLMYLFLEINNEIQRFNRAKKYFSEHEVSVYISGSETSNYQYTSTILSNDGKSE